jgi:hypothetical protein
VRTRHSEAPAVVILAATAALTVLTVVLPADATARQERQHATEAPAPRHAGEPIMAIVSIKSQQVTIYDSDGWILRAPVSTGTTERETPAGVFSVVQKDKDHHSSLYDDAWMPNMLRITWSGISMHGGPLPGHAASHGCVRMPYGFAENLFDKAQIGMRVIIAPRDAEPVEFSHPALFVPNAEALAAASARAKTLAREAAEAVQVADEAKRAAAGATRRAVSATASQRSKLDGTEPAQNALKEAEAKRADTAKAAYEAKLALQPVSAFISRATQRLYVRRGFNATLEAPVTIRNSERPIGTHVFTAAARNDDGSLRWTAVTIDSAEDARTALDRITIPQDVLDSISSIALPRSSLIISDEPLNSETNYRTEFVVVLNNQPQGGLAMRKHPNDAHRNAWDDDSFGSTGWRELDSQYGYIQERSSQYYLRQQ